MPSTNPAAKISRRDQSILTLLYEVSEIRGRPGWVPTALLEQTLATHLSMCAPRQILRRLRRDGFVGETIVDHTQIMDTRGLPKDRLIGEDGPVFRETAAQEISRNWNDQTACRESDLIDDSGLEQYTGGDTNRRSPYLEVRMRAPTIQHWESARPTVTATPTQTACDGSKKAASADLDEDPETEDPDLVWQDSEPDEDELYEDEPHEDELDQQFEEFLSTTRDRKDRGPKAKSPSLPDPPASFNNKPEPLPKQPPAQKPEPVAIVQRPPEPRPDATNQIQLAPLWPLALANHERAERVLGNGLTRQVSRTILGSASNGADNETLLEALLDAGLLKATGQDKRSQRLLVSQAGLTLIKSQQVRPSLSEAQASQLIINAITGARIG